MSRKKPGQERSRHGVRIHSMDSTLRKICGEAFLVLSSNDISFLLCSVARKSSALARPRLYILKRMQRFQVLVGPMSASPGGRCGFAWVASPALLPCTPRLGGLARIFRRDYEGDRRLSYPPIAGIISQARFVGSSRLLDLFRRPKEKLRFSLWPFGRWIRSLRHPPLPHSPRYTIVLSYWACMASTEIILDETQLSGDFSTTQKLLWVTMAWPKMETTRVKK